ncbi:unnamed protein product [Dicrocoelium dendriticum]|nr:unnamed protein product [Dicrocoelium dendriticum]
MTTEMDWKKLVRPDDVVIVASRRSPVGRMSGCLSGLSAHQLGAQVIDAVLATASRLSSDPSSMKEYIIHHLEEVIVGQVFTASTGQNPARQAAILSGIPYSVPAWGVNMLCGSGLKAVCLAYDRLRHVNPDGGWVIAGGQESMSQAPHATAAGASVRRGGGPNTRTLPHLDAYCGLLMGHTAEFIAKKYGLTREQQDSFALESQQKYESAFSKGLFSSEIVPIILPASMNCELGNTVNKDEHPRPGTSMESLARLKPAFSDSAENGTVTAGNASGVNDGAAFLVLCRGDQLKKCDSLDTMCRFVRIVGWHQVGLEPQLMGLGPVSAILGLIAKLGWTLDSVDAFEINEAFAAQSLAVIHELGIPASKVNRWGGGVALGHPLGCTGARILVTLISIISHLGNPPPKKEPLRGIAALCIGGGMGIALAIESFK